MCYEILTQVAKLQGDTCRPIISKNSPGGFSLISKRLHELPRFREL